MSNTCGYKILNTKNTPLHMFRTNVHCWNVKCLYIHSVKCVFVTWLITESQLIKRNAEAGDQTHASDTTTFTFMFLLKLKVYLKLPQVRLVKNIALSGRNMILQATYNIIYVRVVVVVFVFKKN